MDPLEIEIKLKDELKKFEKNSKLVDKINKIYKYLKEF
jgi:hypothetical protein